MTGLDKYAGTKSSIVGSWLDFGGSALKAASSAFGGGGGGNQAAQIQAAQLQAAQMQAQQAQQSASNWKLIGVGGVIAVVVGYFALRKKK